MVALLLLFLHLCGAAIELLNYNPVAASQAVVVSGNARFTVLTERLIRMEYGSGGRFEDRATLAVVNRNVPVPAFSSGTQGGVLTIQTTAISLRYTVGQTFSSSSLSVQGIDSNSKFSSWTYGQTNSGSRNLLGTIRSLDELGVTPLNCTQNAAIIVHDESLHCEWGLVSRDGWALVDESGVPTLTSAYWWDGNSVDTTDLYLFAHGWDYKAALNDYQLIGGKIIIPPRNLAGIMWSRWYDLADPDVKKIVDDYETRSIPLDVFILDMDWHLKNDWTGYTFDGHLFPVASETMDWLHHRGLLTSANLHDADGVASFEKMYSQMATAVGINPSSGQTVAFNLVNSTWAYALEDIVLADVEKQGMDFWWIDWQQGGTGGGCQGQKQNPTIWTNHLRATDRNRRGDTRRAAVLARFGGLGNHRYQVGFSGDVNALSWDNLAYQPYFSWTASNVGYGFWSHDLVGPYDDHEMHTRWLQWGAMSSIFRTHDRGMAVGDCADRDPPTCAIIEVWDVPKNYFEANRDAMRTRAELLPYIYSLWRSAFDNGVSPMRPMYYNFPQYDNAYLGDENGNYAQYMMGDDILIAPVVTPMDTDTQMTTKKIWLPPGKWYETISGMLLTGNSDGSSILSKQYDLSEIPIFVRAGAVLPTRPVTPGNTVGLARQQYTALTFSIYPGGTSDSTKVYEDDGYTVAYLDGSSYVFTTCSYTRSTNAGSTTVKINIQSIGNFTGFPTSRRYVIHLISSIPPTDVNVNGQKINFNTYGGPGTWSYRPEDVTTVVDLGTVSTGAVMGITVTADAIQDSDYSGVKGGIRHAILAKANLDPDWGEPGSSTPGPAATSDLSTLGVVLFSQIADLTAFKATIANYPAMLAAAITELKSQPEATGALTQMYSSARTDSILCGTSSCMSTNSNYQTLRIEGYQPAVGDSNQIPLNDYWSDTLLDNWVTTQSTPPSGYTAAVFSDGYVFSTQKSGTIALQLWYSAAAADHLAVASADGIQWAQSNGYQLLNASLGYVYQNPPSLRTGDPTTARLSYSIALLENANVSPA